MASYLLKKPFRCPRCARGFEKSVSVERHLGQTNSACARAARSNNLTRINSHEQPPVLRNGEDQMEIDIDAGMEGIDDMRGGDVGIGLYVIAVLKLIRYLNT